jgi:LytS/YehU family sensor histidine kinase
MDDEFRLSEVCVPIVIDGNVIGVIDCEHPKKNFFSEHHLHMLLTMSSITAIKLKSVRAQKKYTQEQQKSLDIQKQFLDLKLKVLNSQLNPHFVFNALNSIQYFITQENKKSALEYLSVFSKLIRFYLKYLEKDAVPVSEEIDMLNWYLKLQKLRYEDKFEFEITSDIKSKKIDANIPTFILQTLIENLIEHSIFNQHKNQKLKIQFYNSNTEVLININYEHEPKAIKSIKYTPEYREKIINWQDQIRLLNSVKNYTISKHITFIKDETHIKGNIIKLKLPNLK